MTPEELSRYEAEMRRGERVYTPKNGAAHKANGKHAPEEKAPAEPRFKFLTPAELLALPPPTWAVDGVIPQNGIGVFYGASGSGKTFAALDMACAIVRGIPWYGRQLVRGNVLYIAAEGRLGERLRAYCEHHGIDPAELSGLRILQSRINLMDRMADLPELIEAIRALNMGPWTICIIDTLNRAMAGANENASEDMGLAIDAAYQVAEATLGVVMFVHHSGKDETKGSRGHSSLRAACDFELSIKRDGDARTITLEKSRDGEDGIAIGTYALLPAADSVVCSPYDEPQEAGQKAPNMTPAERIAFETLYEMLDDFRYRKTSDPEIREHGARPGQYVIRIDDWREMIYSRLGSDTPTGTKRQTFNRARDRLLASKRIQIFNDFVWLRT